MHIFRIIVFAILIFLSIPLLLNGLFWNISYSAEDFYASVKYHENLTNNCTIHNFISYV